MRRVMAVLPGTRVGGGREIAHLALSTALRRRGWEVGLLVQDDRSDRGRWRDAVDWLDVAPGPSGALTPGTPVASFRGIVGAAAATRRRRPDVVWCPAWSHVTLAAACAATAGARFVVQLHDPPHPLGRQSRWAARRAAAVICVSDAQADEWIARGVPSTKVVVSWNGVDTETFAPSPDAERRSVRESLGVADGSLVAAVLGRVTERKGTDLAIEAVRRRRAAGGQVELVVVGGPDPQVDAHWGRTLLDANDDLWLHKLGNRPDIARVLAAVDVVVVPSRWFDSMPLVAMEALAAGLPVLGSRIGGLPELLGGVDDCGLVDPGDVDGFVDGLAELEARGGALRRRSAARRAFAESHLGLEAATDRLERFLAEAG